MKGFNQVVQRCSRGRDCRSSVALRGCFLLEEDAATKKRQVSIGALMLLLE